MDNDEDLKEYSESLSKRQTIAKIVIAIFVIISSTFYIFSQHYILPKSVVHIFVVFFSIGLLAIPVISRRCRIGGFSLEAQKKLSLKEDGKREIRRSTKIAIFLLVIINIPLLVMVFNDRTGVALGVMLTIDTWPLIGAIPLILNHFNVSNRFVAKLPDTKTVRTRLKSF